MRYLIIGGTRYMGRVVVDRLLERGDSVTVYSRGNVRPHWWDGVEHIIGDRNDVDDLRSRLHGKSFDAVLDTQAFKKEHVESAVQALEGNVGRYLFVSTGSVYMAGMLDFRTHVPFKESDVDWSTIDYSYPENEESYGVGKRHCEKWLNENSTVPYTIVRIPAVMGWDDDTSRMWWWVQRALDGGTIVVPAEEHPVFRTLYSEDAADNWLRAIASPAAVNQTYHIAMQEIMTVQRWADMVWEAAGTQGYITYVPRAAIDRDETLRGYLPPLCRDYPYVHDLSKAERDFGFTTTPVEQWMSKTVDWYRNSYDGGDSAGYVDRHKEMALAGRWTDSIARTIAEF